MDTSTSVFYAATGLPALVSTGITILYFFLKACSYVINAISHQTKRRVATPTTSGGEQEHCTNPGEESNTEIRQQIQRHISEPRQYGGRPEWPTGTVLLSRRGQTYASLPLGMIQGIQQSPLFEQIQKDCEAEGIELPKDIMAKDPRTHILTPQEYLRNVEAGTMPPINNHNVLKEMAEKAAANDQTRFVMMEFWDFKCPSLPKTPGPQKCK